LIKIYRKWQIDEKIWALLVSDDPVVSSALPGDYIEIEDKRYMILSIKKTMGSYKLEVLAERLPEAAKIDIINIHPEKDAFSIVGPVSDWIIAGLRSRGFCLKKDFKEAGFVIITYPEYIPSLKKKRLIFAPSLSSTWRDFISFNEVFSRYELLARYNLSKSISNVDTQFVTIDVPSLSMQVVYPAKFVTYPIIKGKNDVIIGIYKHQPELYGIIYDPERETVIYSSLAMIIPYELFLEKGNNLDVFIQLATGKKIEIRKEKKEKGVIKVERKGELIFPIGELDPDTVFKKIVEKSSLIGAMLTERNDLEKSATFILTIQDKTISSIIRVSTQTIHLAFKDGQEKIEPATLLFRSLINEIIKELREQKIRAEKLKNLFLVAMNTQEKLITIKDMIEVEMNPFTILEELHKVIGEISAVDTLSDIAMDMANTYDALEKIVKKHGKIPDEIRDELLLRIENWINKLKNKAINMV